MKKTGIIILAAAVGFLFSSCIRAQHEIPAADTQTSSSASQTESETETTATPPITEETEKTEKAKNTTILQTYTSADFTLISTDESFDQPSGGGDVYGTLTITVAEDTYLLNGAEVSLDEIKALTEGLGENITVIIRDELATDNAYTALTDHLNEKGVPYSEE